MYNLILYMAEIKAETKVGLSHLKYILYIYIRIPKEFMGE